MKKLFALLFITFVFPLIGQNLQVNIKLEKKEYMVSEYVILLVECKNSGPDILLDGLQMHASPSYLKLTVTDENNNVLSDDNIAVFGQGYTNPKTLKKGSSVYKSLSIDGIFGKVDPAEGVGIAGQGRFLKPGRYKIKACYTLHQYKDYGKNGKSFWGAVKNSGKPIYSNTLEFSVISPTKENEKRVYNTLKQIQDDLGRKFGPEYHMSIRESITKFKELIKQNPQSAYLHMIYSNLFDSYHSLKQIDELLILSNEFLEKFPDSWIIDGALNYLEALCSNDKSYTQKFDKLLKENANKPGVLIWDRAYYRNIFTQMNNTGK